MVNAIKIDRENDKEETKSLAKMSIDRDASRYFHTQISEFKISNLIRLFKNFPLSKCSENLITYPCQKTSLFNQASRSLSVTPFVGKWTACWECKLEFQNSSHLTLKCGAADAIAMNCSFSSVISGFSLLLQCFVIFIKVIGWKSYEKYYMRKKYERKRRKALTSSRNLSPNFGFAIAMYFENWPLKDCCLLLATNLITAVTSASLLSSLGVFS
jgi:hypothetical protein